MSIHDKYKVLQQNLKDMGSVAVAFSSGVDSTFLLKAALEAFQPLAGNFQFTMNQTGSGDGYKRVLGSEKDGANRADIGFASRAFKSGEEDTSTAMASGQYCIDAVVTIVNEANTAVANLTQAQVHDIFTGTVTSWDQIQ